MAANEATPFTIRDQLERDTKRSVEAAIKSLLQKYIPHIPFSSEMHITRSAHNTVGNVVVRVRVEISGTDIEADWLDERG